MTLEDALTVAAMSRAWRAIGTGQTPSFEAMRAAILSGRYRPRPVTHRSKRKADGSLRRLSIPDPVDRAVQRVVLDALSPSLDGRLDPRVHGSRPGHSPGTAICHLCRQAGRQPRLELVQTDISSLFDTLDHRRLLPILDAASADPLWRTLHRAWLAAWATSPGIGVPQGAPLSPLLANLYLAPLDAQLSGPWIRYVDDIVVAGSGVGSGTRLLSLVDGAARHLGLSLAGHKVHIATTGFARRLTLLGVPMRLDHDRVVVDRLSERAPAPRLFIGRAR